MSDTDINLRAFLWQQTRPAAIRWGVLVLLAFLGWGAAHHWLSSLENATAQARAERDAFAERKRALEDDMRLIAAHREDYRRWVESGLIGTLPVAERRALWLQQWQQALTRWSDKATDYVTLTLEPPQDGSGADAAEGAEPAPQAVPGPSPDFAATSDAAAGVEPAPQTSDAEGVPLTVTHHPLILNVRGLTDQESLDVVRSLLSELGEGARQTACDWKRADSQAELSVEVECRARIVYIRQRSDPAPAAATPMRDR